MTPKAQRIAIAEACGWTRIDDRGDAYAVAHATAAQRAEAFLRTIGKWIDP
jgi:hypothetical protein